MSSPPPHRPLLFSDMANPEALHNYTEFFTRRPILLERGLNQQKLTDTSLYRIEWGSWKRLVAPPRRRINETIVREFYAMLSVEPEERSTNFIMVRGVDVPFHWIDINAAFGLSNTTVAPHQHYETRWNLNNASSFVAYLSAATATLFPNRVGPTAETTVATLSSEMRAWKRFINNRILPTDDFSVITDDELLLLYAIKREVYINWGKLIHEAAWYYARPTCTFPFIPFASLISYLCTRVANVPAYPRDEYFPSPTVRRGLIPFDIVDVDSSSDESTVEIDVNSE